MASFWSACLSQFEQELPPQQFSTWIRPLVPARGGGLRARLAAPGAQWFHSEVGQGTLSGTHRRVGERALFDAGQRRLEPRRTRRTAKSSRRPEQTALRSANDSRPTAALAAAAISANSLAERDRTAYEKTRLIKTFTFDNLIVGKANDLARAASRQVSINPGETTYNPLFIYGGAGLGKTHLIHAIGNHILDNYPDRVVRYVHAEDYYSDVVRAYQQKSFDVFKRYYRSLDVLLLDDVQFFNGKNRTQEEFFYVYNALSETRKQIVISCDTYPKNISALRIGLITRFDWGLDRTDRTAGDGDAGGNPQEEGRRGWRCP
jgi:chromosomal replication initiator protein